MIPFKTYKMSVEPKHSPFVTWKIMQLTEVGEEHRAFSFWCCLFFALGCFVDVHSVSVGVKYLH